MADRLDPDLVDGELALVLGALDIGDDKRIADIHEEPFVTLAQYWRILTCVPFPAFRSSQTRADCGDDARFVQADRSEQLRLVAVIDEAVGEPQLKERGDDRAHGE